jgi:molybdenum cofactor cytidylyltransferase
VFLVIGNRAAEVRAVCADLPLEVVANPAFADGLSTSLRVAFAALPAHVEGAFVLLGDMPRVGAALLDRLAAAWREAGRPAALVPTLAGRRGNPVLLSRALAPEIAGLTGDEGAGRLLRGRPDIVEFAVDDEAVATDVDTPEALRRLAQASTTPSRIAP